ncbi:hypothetical protein K505DRAFT_258116, partial [Melanomma pulvis-pyrius CBS 109.77]
SDVSFALDYTLLRFWQSKTNTNNNGVQIMLARTYNAGCPVIALKRLSWFDPQEPNAPLF